MHIDYIPGKHFRSLLRSELTRRAMINSSYSLRAFAKSLGVSASSLSMIMNGKCPVTLQFIEKSGPILKMDPVEVIEQQTILLKEKSEGIKSDNFEFIEKEKFEIIKDWYHYAILNLMRVKDFKPKPAWIAKRLGIHLGQVQEALDNLVRAGFLKIEGDEWLDLSTQFTSHANNKKFSEAAKENQKQLFEKALFAIDKVDFTKRNHTGSTIALRVDELEDAKQFITDFRKRFIKKYDVTEQADEIYHLSIALFPLAEKDEL